MHFQWKFIYLHLILELKRNVKNYLDSEVRKEKHFVNKFCGYIKNISFIIFVKHKKNVFLINGKQPFFLFI